MDLEKFVMMFFVLMACSISSAQSAGNNVNIDKTAFEIGLKKWHAVAAYSRDQKKAICSFEDLKQILKPVTEDLNQLFASRPETPMAPSGPYFLDLLAEKFAKGPREIVKKLGNYCNDKMQLPTSALHIDDCFVAMELAFGQQLREHLANATAGPSCRIGFFDLELVRDHLRENCKSQKPDYKNVTKGECSIRANCESVLLGAKGKFQFFCRARKGEERISQKEMKEYLEKAVAYPGKKEKTYLGEGRPAPSPAPPPPLSCRNIQSLQDCDFIGYVREDKFLGKKLSLPFETPGGGVGYDLQDFNHTLQPVIPSEAGLPPVY